MKLHLVYATDSRYLFPTRVSACSAIERCASPDELVIDVLDCGILDADWQAFQCSMRRDMGNAFSLKRHMIDMSSYADFKEWHASRGTYARLEIPRLLPDVDWCVYADGDTLFTDDPMKLCGFEDPDVALLGHFEATNGCRVFSQGRERSLDSWYCDHHLPWNGTQHLCSGFLLMNLAWFWETNASARCFELLRHFPDIPFCDQGVLNVVCHGYKRALPTGWGCFTPDLTDDTPRGCLHYVLERPWEMPARQRYMPITPAYLLWEQSLKRTCHMRLWQCPGWSRYKYFRDRAIGILFGVVFSLANQLPGLKGRYNVFLKKNVWCLHAYNRYCLNVDCDK